MVTPVGSPTFCAGGSVVLTSSNAKGYRWTKDGDNIGTNTQSFIANLGGSYRVVVTDANGCESGTSSPTVVIVNPLPDKPTITPSTSTTFCIGGSVILTSSEGSSYRWYRNGGLISGAGSQTYTATTTGKYTVVITNANGCVSSVSAELSVTVNPKPTTPVVTAKGPITFCTGGSVLLESTEGSSYQWYKGTDLIDGATSSTYSATVGGSYRVMVRNSFGCESDLSVAIDVVVNASPTKPTISYNEPIVFCAGGTVVLISSNAKGYQWSKDGVNIGTNAGSFIASESGLYKVIVTNENGCISEASAGVDVVSNPLPVAPSITAETTITFCAGGSVTLTSSTGSSYQWYKDGKIVLAGDFKTFVAKASGKYKVEILNENKCISSPSSEIFVTTVDLPEPPMVTASGPIRFCKGEKVTLSIPSAFSYQWYKDGLAIPGGTLQTLLVTESGSYSGMIGNINGCKIASVNIISIISDPLPEKPLIKASGLISFCLGGSVILTSSTASSYQWFRNGALIPDATSSSYKSTLAGSYTVAVTNSFGCNSVLSDLVKITVYEPPQTPLITNTTSKTFCEGDSVVLTSSEASSYQWFKNGTEISGASNKSLVAYSTGSYSVIGINASGCASVSSAAVLVTSNVLPVIPTITATGPTTFCFGKSVLLKSSFGLTYQWYMDKEIIAGATSQIYSAEKSGSYSVIVTNVVGCKSVQSLGEKVLTEVSNSIPTLSGPSEVCSGSNITLVTNAQPSIQWYRNGKMITGATKSNLIVTQGGDYIVESKNSIGCISGSIIKAVIENPLPIGKLIAPASLIICKGRETLLIATGAYKYQWYNNNIAIPNAKDSFLTVSASGIYTVDFISDKGCTLRNRSSYSLKLIEAPKSIFSFDKYCLGVETKFLNTSKVQQSGLVEYKWIFGDGTIDSLENVSHTYKRVGNYLVQLISTPNGCPSLSDTAQQAISISKPLDGISYEPVNAIAKVPKLLSARSIGIQYTWSPSTYLSGFYTQMPTVTTDEEKLYTISILDKAGCVIVDTQLVRIFKEENIFVPKGFTPDNDGFNDRLYPTLVGIKDLRYFKIFSRWGNLVFDNKAANSFNGWNGTFQGKDLPMDTYTWIAEGYTLDGKLIRRTGNTVLIR